MNRFVMIAKSLVNTRHIVRVHKVEGRDTYYKGRTSYTKGNGNFFYKVETTLGEFTLSNKDYDTLVAELKGERDE